MCISDGNIRVQTLLSFLIFIVSLFSVITSPGIFRILGFRSFVCVVRRKISIFVIEAFGMGIESCRICAVLLVIVPIRPLILHCIALTV